jgi:hypothetical protein
MNETNIGGSGLAGTQCASQMANNGLLGTDIFQKRYSLTK